MKGISAVVATYRRRDELKRLFESVISNKIPNLELIIVDQNKDDLLSDLIASYSSFLDIMHLKMDEANQSKARNFGASKAKYPVICFPDDDCWFDNNSLQQVQKYFQSDPSTDILVINWKQNPIVFDKSLQLTTKEVFSFRSVGYVTYVLFFNQGVFKNLGGFIETIGIGKYIGGGEDSELTFRAARKNLKIYFNSGIYVNHNYIPLNSRDLSTIRSRSRAIGLLFANYDIPKYVILRGLTAPLLKAVCSFNYKKAKEHLNILVGRHQGFYYGLKNRSIINTTL
jgi:glycosyltransferase involved in cell wall biosynthesis